jgi:multicomponent Na+:H+ antiporter subunit B
MRSLILVTAARLLTPLLLLFAVFLLLRGHHRPGGAFIGGLVAAAALALYAIALDVSAARAVFRARPLTLVALGLLFAFGAGLMGLLAGDPFLTGYWTAVRLPAGGVVDLGTPLLFELGVFLIVVGTALTVVLLLAEE